MKLKVRVLIVAIILGLIVGLAFGKAGENKFLSINLATTVLAAEETEDDSSSGPYKLCTNLSGDNQRKCMACASGGTHIWTAIGCLPTDTMGIVSTLISFLMGVAGLFFVIQIIIGASKIIFASGDSGAVTEGRKRITNSIIAILFIIFAVTILQIIGVQILKLPGFFGG